MANTDYTVFLSEVLPECDEVSEPLAINAIRNACRQFCEESTYWRVDHALISSFTDEVSEGVYTLTIPTGAQIVTVAEPMMHNDLAIFQRNLNWLNDNVTEWRDREGPQGEYFFMDTAVNFRLVPFPIIAAANNLRVRMVLKPAPTSTFIESEVYNEWYREISCGAKWMLQAMPNKKWSDEKAAAKNEILFLAGIQEAWAKITAGYSNDRTDRANDVIGHYF